MKRRTTKSSEIRLGRFVFDRETGRLADDADATHELRHQSRRVLLRLANSPNEVVTKQDFSDDVWDGMQVSEDSLVQCIAEIRQTVKDTDKSIIETVPRKGYRLVVPAETPATRNWFRPAAIMAGAVLIFWAIAELTQLRPADEQRVVAVLPFQDDSQGADQGTLGDAIGEGILDNLARYPELLVIARSSSFRFREQTKDIRDIGSQLGANYILEGSQRLDGTKLRVSARLIDVSKNTTVWSDLIETEKSDLFDVTKEISLRVAHAVEAFVSDAGATQHSGGVDALLLHLKARRVLQSGLSPENLGNAKALNQEIIARYPDEPWGYAGLAFVLRTELRVGWADNPEETLKEAIESAETAVRLGPENYLTYFALARVRSQQGNQLAAIEAYERSLQLNPSNAMALNALAQSYFYIGRTQESLDILDQSERIDPLPSFIHSWASAWFLWQANQCDKAMESFARLTAPPPTAHKLLAAIQMCLGQQADARQALSVFLEKNQNWTVARERALHEGIWIAEGSLDRWLADLSQAGLPTD